MRVFGGDLRVDGACSAARAETILLFFAYNAIRRMGDRARYRWFPRVPRLAQDGAVAPDCHVPDSRDPDGKMAGEEG
jgi:hypothetical protein